ncbi:MAG: DNA/RNA non-specific endonuclease [Tumebacillaceae bacterium]
MEKMFESNFIQKTAGMKKKIAVLASVSLASLFVFGAPASAADNDHMLLGNPSGAVTSTSYPNNYLMSKTKYKLSYNNSKLTANWVSWHLGASDLGSVPRQDDFRADTTLPSGWYRVTDTDYASSGFDRGHLCPSADRTNTISNNSSTFLMTNMIPQAPNNNQQTWGDLEDYARTLVGQGKELYIIAGGAGVGGTGLAGYKTTIGPGITVPAYTWKVLVVLPEGTNDLTRITSSTRVIAVKMPNTQTVNSQPWGYYRVSVDSLESLTGYNFLSAVSTTIQSTIESKVDTGPTF